ncbi:hypothetical protein D5086_005972 [Populus alba]|uniref:Uncharacterized protein n=2 Tax=Populus alba TaxID=43335 RepID=A0ACC4AR93_POPAL
MEEEESSKWDYDGKDTPEEVAAAAMYLKDTSGKEGIQELTSCGDVLEGYGKILVEDIVKLGSWTEDAKATEEREM